MNALQRISLFVFAAIVFVASGSYTQSDNPLRWFLIAVLLFFALSPSHWFSLKKIQSVQCIPEEIPKSTEYSLPSIGFLNQEKVLILETLFNLRSAEIGSIYHAFRGYQKRNKESEWIATFMQDYASHDFYRDIDPWATWGSDTHAESEAIKEDALEIFEKRHYGSFFGPEQLHESKIADIKLALTFSSFSPEKMMSYLQEIKALGFIEDKILEIIKGYKYLEDITEKGEFESIFKETGSDPEIKRTFARLSVLWAEISRLLKMSISMNRVKDKKLLPKDTELLDEIEALLELEKHLDWAITEPNEGPLADFSDFPKKRLESFFMKRLKFNPFWEDSDCESVD